MKRISLLALLTALLLLTACGTPPDILVIGAVDKQIGVFPIIYSQSTGLLSPDEYRFRYYSSEERLASALAKNRVDVAVLPFTQLIGTDTPVRLVDGMMRNGGGIVAKATSFEDAHGATIGVYDDYLVSLAAVMATDSLRLDWKLIEYGSRQALTEAWKAGEVDAVADAAPYIYGYRGESDSILWFSELFDGYPSSDLFANEKALAEKKEKIDQLTQAAEFVASYINAYPSQTNELFTVTYPFRQQIAELTLSHVWYYPKDDETTRAFRAKAARMMGVSPDSLYITQ